MEIRLRLQSLVGKSSQMCGRTCLMLPLIGGLFLGNLTTSAALEQSGVIFFGEGSQGCTIAANPPSLLCNAVSVKILDLNKGVQLMCTARPTLQWTVVPNSQLRTIHLANIRAECMELPLKYSGGSTAGSVAAHQERVSLTDQGGTGSARTFGNAVWLYNKATSVATLCISYSFANAPFFETACEDAQRRPAK